jgi:hypothetical protein
MVPRNDPSEAVTNELVPRVNGLSDERVHLDRMTVGATAMPTTARQAAATTRTTKTAISLRPRWLRLVRAVRRRRAATAAVKSESARRLRAMNGIFPLA